MDASNKNESDSLDDSFDEMVESIDFAKVTKDKFKFSNNLKSLIE